MERVERVERDKGATIAKLRQTEADRKQAEQGNEANVIELKQAMAQRDREIGKLQRLLQT